MMKPINRTLGWVTAYGVAMGVLEAAVVIYLRRLYFPSGFHFPLWVVDTNTAIVELCREAATIVMLAAVGALAGRSKGERFAYFIYAFAVWDLIYYVFLKLAIDWPESLLTWDVLFLLPVPWIGPVIAPCIIAVMMIAFAVTTVRFTSDGVDVDLAPREKALIWIGAFIVVVSFTIDWVRFEGPIILGNIAAHRRPNYMMGSFVPVSFPWWIFVIGASMILTAFVFFRRRLATLGGSPRR